MHNTFHFSTVFDTVTFGVLKKPEWSDYPMVQNISIRDILRHFDTVTGIIKITNRHTTTAAHPTCYYDENNGIGMYTIFGKSVWYI